MYNQNNKNKKGHFGSLTSCSFFTFWSSIDCGPFKLLGLIVQWKFLLKCIAFNYIFWKNFNCMAVKNKDAVGSICLSWRDLKKMRTELPSLHRGCREGEMTFNSTSSERFLSLTRSAGGLWATGNASAFRALKVSPCSRNCIKSQW